MRVSEIMTPSPIAMPSTATVHEAIDRLMAMDPRHLPIVDDGQVVGMVSERELRPFMRAAVPQTERLLELAAHNQPVHSILKRSFPTVSADSHVRDVARAMVNLRIEALPVVEGHSRKLVGMVSYVDVLRVAAELL